jgi:hypothetical protein
MNPIAIQFAIKSLGVGLEDSKEREFSWKGHRNSLPVDTSAGY